MMTIPMHSIAYPGGVYALDTGYHAPQHDALYVVVDQGRVALIDCGTNHSLPRIEQFLTSLGLDLRAVEWLILTHIHLDHAGGAGGVLQHCPNARLVVHPRGAAHMANPAKLIAATEAVYGVEETARLYGTLIAIEEARILITNDGMEITLGNRQLTCIDAPGHAKHHIAIRDSVSGGFFTGDTFGLSYREFDQLSPAGLLNERDELGQSRQFVFPTTTPSQFDPEVLCASQARIASYAPSLLYLTHYGAVRFTPALVPQQATLIRTLARWAREIWADTENTPHSEKPARLAIAQQQLVQKMGGLLAKLAADEEWAHPEQVANRFAMDIELNAQGLLDWARRMS